MPECGAPGCPQEFLNYFPTLLTKTGLKLDRKLVDSAELTDEQVPRISLSLHPCAGRHTCAMVCRF